jgi:hypothetical protein
MKCELKLLKNQRTRIQDNGEGWRELEQTLKEEKNEGHKLALPEAFSASARSTELTNGVTANPAADPAIKSAQSLARMTEPPAFFSSGMMTVEEEQLVIVNLRKIIMLTWLHALYPKAGHQFCTTQLSLTYSNIIYGLLYS